MNKSLVLITALLLSGGVLAVQPVKTSNKKTTAAMLPATTPLPTVVVAPPFMSSLVEPETEVANHIVALVNSDPITNQEVHAQLARLQIPAGAVLPPRAELLRQVMERLILERVQLQAATDMGLKVDDAMLTQAEENLAKQNNLTLPQFHARIKALGHDLDGFRQNLGNELLLQRLREREIDSRVKVGEKEIDDYLKEHQTSAQIELNLAQILIRVPEDATPSTTDALRQRAEQIAQKAQRNPDFSALVREFSQAPDKNNGGQLGLRPADRYPSLFVDVTRLLQVGQISPVVRSGAGFHILKVLEKRQPGLPDSTYVQTHVRHILLRPTQQLSQEAAIQQLQLLRERIVRGEVSFAEMARQYSQDGSASAGGDLGWAKPGQFVPEFEEAMNQLGAGNISQPLVSRFGVHLLQVQERREVSLSTRELRDWVRNAVREQKIEQTHDTWLRDLRGRAYIEYRDPPQ